MQQQHQQQQLLSQEQQGHTDDRERKKDRERDVPIAHTNIHSPAAIILFFSSSPGKRKREETVRVQARATMDRYDMEDVVVAPPAECSSPLKEWRLKRQAGTLDRSDIIEFLKRESPKYFDYQTSATVKGESRCTVIAQSQSQSLIVGICGKG